MPVVKPPILVQELQRYTLNQLRFSCHATEEEIIPVIRRLREHGIIMVSRENDEQRDTSELMEETSEFMDVDTDGDQYYYAFSFVGVVIVSGFVFKVYPKYIKEADKEKELRLVLKVLEKYNKGEEVIKLFSDTKESKFTNLLSVLLFFVKDYYENGSYRNTEVVFESNGQGEINWDNTINKSFAIICDNKPFYLEVQTRKRIDDETDYFKRLHECIISKASKELETAGLLDLFDLEKADLSDESIEDFGDKDYILYKINKELNVQYVSWKQIILKAMSAYIASSGTLSDINCFSVFGTTCFEVLWERLCSEVLDNKLRTPLKNLLPQTKLKEDHKNAKLIDIIEKPKWTFTDKYASKTLIPDIISIEKINGKQVFAIIDAKYYDPVLEEGKTPSNQPGIESVTKQYLYQLAYTDFINKYGFSKDIILNCFIFPSEKEYVEKKGEVVMSMFNDLKVKPKLNGIHILFVPASKFYQLYLESKKISINDIFNICCSQF